MGYEEIDALVRAGTEGESPAQGVLSWFRYTDTIEAYVNAFGDENVIIFLYEQFREEPRLFITKLSHFLGVNEKKSLRLMENSLKYNASREGDTYYKTSRLYHLLSSMKSQWLPNAPSVRGSWLGRRLVDLIKGRQNREVVYSPDSVERLKEFYGEENRWLAAECDLPLRDRGYFVSGGDH